MDPYLEDRGHWPDLHQRLIYHIGEALRPQLRPNYVARIGEHVEIAGFDRQFVPDLIVLKRPGEGTPRSAPGAMVADAPTTVSLLRSERLIPYLEIVHRGTQDVVTLVEVLSPSNKSGTGRTEYLAKQAEVLASGSHFVEIDLLSSGIPTVGARPVIPFDDRDSRYVVSISRAPNRRVLEVYAFGLRERLPRCAIPLRGDDPDVILDLPAVLARAYDSGDYDLVLDYSQPPPVALSDTDTAWVQALLKERGLVPE